MLQCTDPVHDNLVNFLIKNMAVAHELPLRHVCVHIALMLSHRYRLGLLFAGKRTNSYRSGYSASLVVDPRVRDVLITSLDMYNPVAVSDRPDAHF